LIDQVANLVPHRRLTDRVVDSVLAVDGKVDMAHLGFA
jgi:hypothetical protein